MSQSHSIQISLRLADGTHYPVFGVGERGQKRLTLVPAHKNQAEVLVRLFLHSDNGTEDQNQEEELGVLSLNELPLEEGALEFEASLDEDGSLSATLIHQPSEMQDSLELSLEMDDSGWNNDLDHMEDSIELTGVDSSGDFLEDEDSEESFELELTENSHLETYSFGGDDSSSSDERLDRKTSGFRALVLRVCGAVFVVAGLALFLFFAYQVTDWGLQDPQMRPEMSSFSE